MNFDENENCIIKIVGTLDDVDVDDKRSGFSADVEGAAFKANNIEAVGSVSSTIGTRIGSVALADDSSQVDFVGSYSLRYS